MSNLVCLKTLLKCLYHEKQSEAMTAVWKEMLYFHASQDRVSVLLLEKKIVKCGFLSQKLDDLLHKTEKSFLAWQYSSQWLRNSIILLSGCKPCT